VNPGRPDPQLRRIRWIALLGLPLLTACSPVDVSGVMVSESGRPVLVNCGAYFRSVDARDASSGETLWSARAAKGSEYGVGEIEIGVLPADDWEELTALEVSSTPDEWRFEIGGLDLSKTRSIDVAAGDLAVGRVLSLDDKSSMTFTQFDEDRCGNSPIIPSSLALLMAGAMAVGAIGVAILRWRRR
jgi:hypothetical protein